MESYVQIRACQVEYCPKVADFLDWMVWRSIEETPLQTGSPGAQAASVSRMCKGTGASIFTGSLFL